ITHPLHCVAISRSQRERHPPPVRYPLATRASHAHTDPNTNPNTDSHAHSDSTAWRGAFTFS
ncbi:hypothetical protein, partial [Synechococcus sp. W60.3]|uniref:hypothetical protein n=1 Tax=Synechococcus sp. W60.3 TaxID=2967125 RepID=UPI0039C6625A